MTVLAGNRKAAAAAVALVAAVGLAHGGALRAGFVSFDDPIYVTEVPEVRAGLTADGVAWAFGFEGRRTYFHPLTWLSLMLDAELFGLAPWGFHLVNVLLHALNATLLFLLLWRATLRPWPAFAAALLWAVHPLTVEAVTWVAERKAVLSTAFAFAAMLVHAAHARRRSPWRLAGAAVLLALGALAKPAVVVVPAILLALDLWPLARLRLPWVRSDPADRDAPATWRLVAEKLPAVGLALGVVAVGMASLEKAYGAGFQVKASLGERIAVALATLPTYLGAALWPTGLAVFHPYPAAVDWGRTALGAALLVGATAGAVVAARRWPAGLACWAWFLAALSPYLGLYQAGLWPGWAERFAYLPLAGLAAAAAYGAADLARRAAWGRWAAGAGLAAAGAALVAATHAQVAVWRENVSLFEASARSEPGVAVIHSHLGKALAKAGRPDEARTAFERAVAIDPRIPWANAELASMLFALGDHDGARRHFLAALPAWRELPEVLAEYAKFLEATGDPVQAAVYRGRFLDAAARGTGGAANQPRVVELHLAAGRVADAEALLQQMLTADPGDAWANAQLGTLLMRRGEYAGAERHLSAALRARPDMLEALFNLAEVLRASGQLPRALPYYERFAATAPPQYEAQRRQALGYLGRR